MSKAVTHKIRLDSNCIDVFGKRMQNDYLHTTIRYLPNLYKISIHIFQFSKGIFYYKLLNHKTIYFQFFNWFIHKNCTTYNSTQSSINIRILFNNFLNRKIVKCSRILIDNQKVKKKAGK